MSLMTKSMAHALRHDRDCRRAAIIAPYREAGNEAPRCPWIYRGFGEPPAIPREPSGASVDAGTIERRLEARLQNVLATYRAGRHG
jgi:hypothetical protein